MSKPVINQHQPTLTEWFAQLGQTERSQELKAEDNSRTERLEVLYQTVGLPYERAVLFTARELKDGDARFMEHLEKFGDGLCALRLVPNDPNLPKLRQRGLSLHETYEGWFLPQQIDWDQYRAYVLPHNDTLQWSGIFVVNDDIVFGEVIRGMHCQLTQGETEEIPYQFRYDGSEWQWSESDPEAMRRTQQMVEYLRIDPSHQSTLTTSVRAQWNSFGLLKGYFETTVWPDGNMYFIDYNRMLPALLPSPSGVVPDTSTDALVTGTPAFAGVARGVVVIVDEQNLASVDMPDGAILVTDNTDVRFLPLMKRAGAVITNRGGMLSHAAIVCRELRIPCIVNAKNATTKLKTSDIVEVDAERGVVILA